MVVPTLGELVKGFRSGRNMSRAVFAKRSGVDPSTVYNIEKGKTISLRTEQFERVAKLMGMDAEALRRETNKTDAPPITLSPEMSAKVRERAAAENRDPLEWLEFAVNNVGGEKPKRLPGSVRQRSGNRRPPPAGARSAEGRKGH